jgi:hypothetical protein
MLLLFARLAVPALAARKRTLVLASSSLATTGLLGDRRVPRSLRGLFASCAMDLEAALRYINGEVRLVQSAPVATKESAVAPFALS